nr:replication protein A 70 kDa DNA-binding subunit [Tanacetum cinerariifolium]
MAAYADMPKPVIIAVSSTWATRKYGGLQLTATPATHYYLNPNIPEATYILNVYADFINPVDALQIQLQPYSEESQEQMRNRYCIETLLNVNPQHYKGARFTTEATILEITAPNGNPTFTLDAFFTPNPQPLLTLPGTEQTTPPPVEFQHEEASSTKADDQCQDTNTKQRDTKAKRQLFEDQCPSDKRQRQDK